MIHFMGTEEEITGMLTMQDIITATDGKVVFEDAHTFKGISIDSRTIKEDELFIALRGNRFDGHYFLDKALGKGSGALIDRPLDKPLENKTIIIVKNTLKALQDIAHFIAQLEKTPK